MTDYLPDTDKGNSLETPLPIDTDRREDPELFLQKVFERNPREGMDILFRTYYGPLCSHAVRFVYSKQIAEDLVSEVFFQFYRTRAYQDIRISYTRYLFRSVRNEAYSYLSREFGRTTLLESYIDQEQLPSAERPDTDLHYNHLYRKINELVASLPKQCQKVFLLSRFESKKYQEIADELNISPKTVEVHISKALRHLRLHLKGEWLALFLFFIH